jgi:hypothetical protein
MRATDWAGTQGRKGQLFTRQPLTLAVGLPEAMSDETYEKIN